MFVAEIECRSR